MQQFRIIDNKIYGGSDVPLVGLPNNQDYPVLSNPDKVLIFRTALGVGDWVMLERLPKAIKSYYPNCKVYLPSPKMIAETFGGLMQNWSSWGDVSRTVELVFKNNPYIDGYVDTWEGEVYSDHWRIYDENNWKTPLVRQMARFYDIPDSFEIDYTPMVYFNHEELVTGTKLMMDNFGMSGGFNFLHLSNRTTVDDITLLVDYIKKNKLHRSPFLYYYAGDIKQTGIKGLDFRWNISDVSDPRMQFFVKSHAMNVIGTQTGATDVICGKAKVHSLHHSDRLEETFRVGNYLPPITYIKRPTDD